jgi:prophage antirepressor-like protein
MGTKKFQRWFLPEILPTVRHGDEVKRTNDLAKWVEGKEKAGGRTIAEKLMAETAEEARSPVGSLMWSEVESVWQARSYITQGHVKVNGYVVSRPRARV